MIEVRNITKSYGNERVLDDVSLTISPGEITAFIGPNGAGKTTLLSIISRLLKPDSGSVLIENKLVEDWHITDLAKKISILKQSNFLNIRLTVRDLVGFGRFPYSGGRLNEEDKKAVESALGFLDLSDIAEKDLNELSGGQRQRAFIAMVVAQDTDCILLDEPLNNLDMRHASDMMRTLRRLTDELGKTIVVVLHDINFASFHADQIIALKNGKLAAKGNAETMIREDVLRSIFDVDLSVTEVGGKKICIYY